MGKNIYQKLINTRLDPIPLDVFNKHRTEIYATLDSIVPLNGVAILATGTATVSNTLCTASSKILLTSQTDTVTGILRAISSSGSFVIKSSNGSDAGNVAWILIP